MIDSAQFGPRGPGTVAAEWVKAVLKEHNMSKAWPLMTKSWRQTQARAWVEANASHPALAGADLDDLCADLGADEPTAHPLWGGFATSLIAEFHKKWTHINPENCGFLSYPRPIGVDRELIVYVDKGFPEPAIVAGSEWDEAEFNLPFVGFVMYHGEHGWLVEDFDLDGRFVSQPLMP